MKKYICGDTSIYEIETLTDDGSSTEYTCIAIPESGSPFLVGDNFDWSKAEDDGIVAADAIADYRAVCEAADNLISEIPAQHDGCEFENLEDLASQIKSSGEWEDSNAYALIQKANFDVAYSRFCYDAEGVIYAAADKLGVDIG